MVMQSMPCTGEDGGESSGGGGARSEGGASSEEGGVSSDERGGELLPEERLFIFQEQKQKGL